MIDAANIQLFSVDGTRRIKLAHIFCNWLPLPQTRITMIQRIQSVFLALIPVVLGAMFFFPLATIKGVDGTFTLWMSGFCVEEGAAAPSVQTWFIPVLGILAALLSVVVIFLYKNRILQLRLNRIVSITIILFVATIFFTVDRTVKQTDLVGYAYNLGAYLSLVPPFLVYLANGRIRKDEMKVRAADRIR